jgi:hypothetical protein
MAKVKVTKKQVTPKVTKVEKVTKVAPVTRANTKRVSDEEMQDMFERSYQSIASLNNIDSFECKCSRVNGKTNMEVIITGFAGNPTLEDFKKGELDNVDSVVVKEEGRPELEFTLEPSLGNILNSSDYIVVYRLEA